MKLGSLSEKVDITVTFLSFHLNGAGGGTGGATLQRKQCSRTSRFFFSKRRPQSGKNSSSREGNKVSRKLFSVLKMAVKHGSVAIPSNKCLNNPEIWAVDYTNIFWEY